MNVALRIFAVTLLALFAHGVSAQQAFPSADAAAAELIVALGTERADPEKLIALLGEDWHLYIPTENIDREDVDAFLVHYKEQHRIQLDSPDRAHLVVGNTPWILPIPMVKAKDGWRFDPKTAAVEIRTRRIGRNEVATLQAIQAYFDAQMDYADIDRDGDGVLEYAQQFMSSDGQYDGLYWPEEEGLEHSPLGPLFGDALPGDDWHGYHYRILSSQGESAPGGAYDYRLGDNMSRGFAVIAWPAQYDDSGVMSFMISHEGQVFEKDLGPETEKLAQAMPRFDPDSSWSEVEAQPEP